MTKRWSVKAEVLTPEVPNFLQFAAPGAKVSPSGARLDIADISDQSLRRIGRLWTEELIQRAAERRSSRDAPDAGHGTAPNIEGRDAVARISQDAQDRQRKP